MVMPYIPWPAAISRILQAFPCGMPVNCAMNAADGMVIGAMVRAKVTHISSFGFLVVAVSRGAAAFFHRFGQRRKLLHHVIVGQKSGDGPHVGGRATIEKNCRFLAESVLAILLGQKAHEPSGNRTGCECRVPPRRFFWPADAASLAPSAMAVKISSSMAVRSAKDLLIGVQGIEDMFRRGPGVCGWRGHDFCLLKYGGGSSNGLLRRSLARNRWRSTCGRLRQSCGVRRIASLLCGWHNLAPSF